MTHTSHTPGPWKLGGWGEEIGITSERAGELAPIAIIDKSTSYWADSQCDANARLIAEAPAMLEALKHWVEDFAEDSCWCLQAERSIECPRCTSRAIIARIEGA